MTLGPLLTAGRIRSTIAGLGLTTSTIYAFATRQPAVRTALQTSLNTGLTAASFFALREYIVSPLLVSSIPTSQYTRRRDQIRLQEELKAYPNFQTTQNERRAVAAIADRAQHGPLTYNEIRLHNMADTAISAGVLGGSLNFVRLGPRGLLPGVLTATLACSALQLLFNEVWVTRIKWMYEHSKEDVDARRAQPMTVQTEPTSTPDPSVPTRSETPRKPTPKTWSDSLLGVISYIIPLSRIPDDQFLADLRRRKTEVDQQLEEVEKQLGLVQSHAGKHGTSSPTVVHDNQK